MLRTQGGHRSQRQQRRRWLIAGGGLVLAVVGAAMVSSWSTTPPPPAIDRAPILAAELKHPAMLEVERRFICPCGSCGGLELTECVCDGLGGAMEMKTELARLIAGGSDADDATVAVAARFGGLKPREAWGGSPDSAVEPMHHPVQPEPSASEPIGDGRSGTGAPAEHDADATVTAVVTHARVVSPQDVASVAEAFMCPCRRCRDRLVDCTCEHPGGAGEVKEYIRQQLSAGARVSDVTELVARRFAAVRS